MTAMIPESENLHRRAVIEHINKQIPRHVLAHYPTPLMRANRLTETLGDTELWFKRDDLISFGLGGNKIRGLEVILADALAQNADCRITRGRCAVQSCARDGSRSSTCRHGLHS